MTMAEYLNQTREANQEWLADFRARYDIPAQRTDDQDQFLATAEDVYEAHSHHSEYGGGQH